LVAAARAVLVHPQLAARRLDRGALRIAMAVAPNLRLGAAPADERIVGRYRAVRPDAHDLAEVVAEILRLIAKGEMIPEREEQVAVLCLDNAAAEMVAARQRALLAEDHLDVVEARRAVLDEVRPRHRGARAAAGCFGEAEIDGLVLRVVAVERYVVQAALALRKNLRHPGERRRRLAVAGDDAQPPGPFGHQHALVG